MEAKRIKELLDEQSTFDGRLTTDDENAYKVLFETLNEEPDIHVPMNFADKVASKVMTRATLWSDVKLYAFYSGLFLFLLGIAVVFFGFDTTASGQETQNVFIENLPLIILGTLTYFVIQSLDRMLVKGR